MFRLFVVRKKTRKSIIPAQIFSPFTILLQKHMANPDSASVHLGTGKGCFKSLFSAAAAKTVSTAPGMAALGKDTQTVNVPLA